MDHTPPRRHLLPPNAFPVAEYIRDEMEARGWTESDLACAMGCSAQRVHTLLTRPRKLTRRLAVALERATGASATCWLNLDRAFWALLEAHLHYVAREQAEQQAPKE